MNPRPNRERNDRLQWKSTFVLIMTLIGFASVAEATYSLPSARGVSWEGNVGVLNDIPGRTAIYKMLSPSGGDDTPAIQTAITTCPAGQVVKLNAGTFKLRKSITIKSGVTLRGSGMGTTTIMGTSGFKGNYVLGFSNMSSSWNLSNRPSIPLSGGMTKGSTGITTSVPHGWQVGDVIVIDQLINPYGDPIVTNVGIGGVCTWCGRGNGG